MVEKRTFNGRSFRRYPDAENESDARYFKRSGGILHREVYAQSYGPIPAGMVVHHKDNDATNNDPDNLQLVSHTEHAQLHKKPFDGKRKAHLDDMRPLAAIWHRSPEGRQWHSEHGRQAYAERTEATRNCEHCGQPYQTRHRGRARFCSNKCKAAWRRAVCVDNEERICVNCEAAFSVNRFSKQLCCCRVCGQRVRSRKSASLQPDCGGST